MERQARIFKNTSDHEVFDAQLGVTLGAGERVSIVTAYHMPPSKQEIIDITDMPEHHDQAALPTETVAQPAQQEGDTDNVQ